MSVRIAAAFLVVTTAGCLSSDPANETSPGSVAEASGRAPSPAPDPLKTLGGVPAVYVPIEPASLLSLDEALAEKGYGNVKATDLKRQFVYRGAEFGNAMVAYSNSDWIPSNTLFEPMSVTQWLDAALEDRRADGIVLDPGRGGAIALSDEEIIEALAKLPRQPELPMETILKQ